MIKHTRTLGGIAAALLTAVAAAGCTEYIEASNPSPQILGVTVADANDNESATQGWCNVSFEQCPASNADCSGYCSRSTLGTCLLDSDCAGSCNRTQTWGCEKAADCPGFCSTSNTKGCSIDDDCPYLETCINTIQGSCSVSATPCFVKADCPTGEVCSLPGNCSTTKTTACNTLKHCSGATTQTCTKDADCPVTTPAQTCRVVECPGTETCVPTPSQTCNLAAQTCVGAHGFCSSTTGVSCLADGDCPGYCANDNTVSCLTDAGCPGSTCVTATPQTCVLPGSCSSTTGTACAVNSQCPAGETCNNSTGALQTCNYPESGNPYDWPYPVRAGPMWDEGYVGDPVTSPASWVLPDPATLLVGVPSGPWPSPKDGPYLWARPRIIFNKLMDGASIQPDPTICEPTANFTVTASPGGDVTADFGVCYDPSSPSPYYGAAVFLNPASGRLRAATTYQITGTVLDKGGISTPVDFTVITAP